MAQIVLLPIAPILLLPFIAIFFIVVFPLWLVAMAVLGLLLGITRGIDAVLSAMKVKARVSGPISNAFHWTLSWGGIANRRDRLSGKEGEEAAVKSDSPAQQQQLNAEARGGTRRIP
jgi:hypothetical protein